MRCWRTLLVLLALLLSGLAAGPTVASDPTPAAAETDAPAAPGVRVRVLVRGLEHPWDVEQLPRGQGLLITERDKGRVLWWHRGRLRELARPGRAWINGETGVMSLALARDFVDSRTFYLCTGWQVGDGAPQVRVTRWRFRPAQARAKLTGTVLSGIRVTRSGRHGGCRLMMARSGALYVGTGDAAIGRLPQDRRALNGKVLRIDPETGKPWPGNPWPRAASPKRRLVLTYGHRNVQGLAQRADGRVWSVEHGPDRDDEVNLLGPGRNFGWNPVPGYNESVPMTDFSLPGRQWGARWSSGVPTLATSGADWVPGSKSWGRLRGTLAVASLKASRMVFMRFDGRGRWQRNFAPAALQRHGRLRSVTRTRGGALLITTDNGDRDVVLRVTPR